MHKKVKKLLVWSLVVSMVLTNMLFSNLAFAATKSSALASARLAGADRYQTAVEISKADWTTSQYAVLAYGEGFADALAAAPLAAKYDAPILLTDKAALSAGVLDELKRLGVKNVFIVGGEGVVSKAVADALVAAGMTPERLAGADRYATALAVANKLGTTTEVVVAYGEGFADALSISSIAAAKGMPILLTDKDAMSADVKAYIGTKKAYVVGGEGVVGAAVFNGLTGAVRLSGADRYATNLAVLQQFAAELNWLNVFVATGEGFADALAGSALAARYGSPVVLADSAIAAATSSFLAGKVNSQSGVIAFGGAAVVSDSVVGSVKPAAPATLGVESVTTMGLNGVKVVFSQEVDKDTAVNVTHYQFDGISLTNDDDVAILASDNKTLTLILNDKFDQYKKTLFTIKDKVVLAKDTLTSIPKYEKDLVFSDVSVPEIASVSVTGNKKINVTFAEPVKIDNAVTGTNASTLFKIDGQYLSAYGFTGATATTQTSGGTVNGYGTKIALNFDVAIPAGAHTLKMLKGSTTNFADVAGYFVAETDKSFTVESVATAPQVVSVVAETNGTIYVTYDRAMDTNADEAARYDLNGAGAGVGLTVSFKANTDDKVVKIVKSSSITEGANVLSIDNEVKDAYGNKLHSSDDQRFSFTATKDTTKPTVASVVIVDSTHIRVKFNEDVNSSYATQLSNYQLKNASGEEKALKAPVVVTSADDTYTLETVDKLTGSNYTLKVKNIIDKASPSNTMDEYIATVSGKDDVSPEVKQAVVASGSKAAIYFSEAMDPATVTDPANYKYTDDQGTPESHSLPASSSITLGENGKYVTIEFPSGYSVTNTAFAPNSSYHVVSIRVSNVKDVAGNLLKDISAVANLSLPAAAQEGKPKYVANSFKVFKDSSKAWAEFELDQTLSSLDVADFYIAGAGALAPSANTTASSGYVSGKKVVLNFVGTNDVKRDALMLLGAEARLYTTTETASKNISGVTVTTFTGTQVYDDAIAPEWAKINGDFYAVVTDTVADWVAGSTVLGNAVVLKFTEALDDSIPGLYKDDFTFSSSAGYLLTVTGTVVSGEYIVYTFKDTTTLTVGDKVTVKAQSGKIDIRDKKDSGAENYNSYVPKTGDIDGRANKN